MRAIRNNLDTLLFCPETANGNALAATTLLTLQCAGERGEVISLRFRVILSCMSWKLVLAACPVPQTMMVGGRGCLYGGLCRNSLYLSAPRAADDFSFTYCNVSFTVIICLVL